jgi:acetoin:2,6-dichlorophenolindophenol oxidoreductase subunit alpha
MTAAATREDVRSLEELLLRMWQIRAFEVRAMELFEENLIRGSVHPYVGMEAIAVGACAALGPDDFITSTHRGHGHCIAKGLDLKLMMAEIIGREDGYCRGRGGSMHITAIDKGMLGADAIVAGSSAIAVGAAHGLRLQGRDGVVLCFFGDGAANQGILHEACNLGAVLSAPAVFICENNEWAISTPAAASTRIANIADRAAGYGIPGEIVDGNDVLGVRSITAEAVARARAGEGPTLIEAKVSRLTAHSSDDQQTKYRSEEELAAEKGRDPLPRFRSQLVDAGVLTPEAEARITASITADVDDATEYAESQPDPDPATAMKWVFAEDWPGETPPAWGMGGGGGAGGASDEGGGH